LRKRVYLSGPISNGGADEPEIQKHYMARAAAAAQEIMDMGYAVLCPHLTVHQEELTGVYNSHETWIENDLPWVGVADVVVRLPGASKGADYECDYARKIGIPVCTKDEIEILFTEYDTEEKAYYGPELTNPVLGGPTFDPESRIKWFDAGFKPEYHETKADKAKELVYGPREEDYGHPYDDFSRTALLWSAILGVEVRAWQVALMMVLLKISREVNKPGEDNVVDSHGYLLTYDRVLEREER
jgi:hypothetical protein